MPSDTGVFLKVLLGADKPADIAPQCARVDVHDEDRGTDKCTITMDDQAQYNTSAIREGAAVRVEMGWESEHAVMFVGTVRRVESAARADAPGRLRFTAFDPSERMNLRPETANRQHAGTLEAVLKAIAEEHKLALGAVLIDPMPSWTEDHPLQQGTLTTWQMIQQLADEYHARAFVEFNAKPDDDAAARTAGGRSRLYFISEEKLLEAAPLGEMRFCRGVGPLLSFDFRRVGSGASPSVEANGIDGTTGEPVSASGPEVAADEPAGLSAAQVRNGRQALGDGSVRSAEAAVDLANREPLQPADVRARARLSGTPSDGDLLRRRVQQDPTRRVGLHGTGLCMGSVFVRAKGAVDITGLSDAASGRWYVKRVNHVVEQAPTEEARKGAERRLRQTFRTRFEATR